MKTVVIATNNKDKAVEIATVLNFADWEFKTLRELDIESDPEEDASTFEGNARIKALSARESSGGMAVLADDSGLIVDALNGEPGVYSARYAGEVCTYADNNRKLLDALAGVADKERTARFASVIVFVDEDGTELVSEGLVEGVIGHEERGEGGFGYDPLFLPVDYNLERTLSEISMEEKNAISHRGRALRELRCKLEEKYQGTSERV